MKSFILTCSFTLFALGLQAQQGVTQCGTPTGQNTYPVQEYNELPDPQKTEPAQWSKIKGTLLSWGDTDARYSKNKLPQVKMQKKLKLFAWKGERVNAQALVWTGTAVDELKVQLSDFKGKKGGLLSKDDFSADFVRYVMADELNKDKKGACGHRDHTLFDSLLVADPIDHLLSAVSMEPMTVQGIWVKCQIPEDAQPGIYNGTLTISDRNGELGVLELELTLSSRVLSKPSEWAFHLDLWQNPFAVARYYQVPLWSEAHLDAMRPIMKMLADAGQKVITASIMHKPWDGQTEDYFETMVTWMKKADGTWSFDYTVFDRWVEFMMSTGIKKQINCYSMVPWKLSFQYFDQATNSLKEADTAPGEAVYEEMWHAMLTSFSAHLREKGWFDITTIAMDERPMEVMQKTLQVIKKADPEFKVSLAGNYHGEIESEIYDYCISIAQVFPKEVKERRLTDHLPTTYYTSCAEAHPNTFSFSDPAESAWMCYYSAKDHLNGYLRWAYNSWPQEPLLDSRFRTWASGDTYFVYPGARSSIRFEKLIEGIQMHEKITLLRQEFRKKKNHSSFERLEKALEPFRLEDFPQVPAARTVQKARSVINSL